MIRIKDDGTVVEREEYKAILVGVSLGEDISYSLEELEGLAEAAGIETLGVMTQNAEKINAATYIGKGKLDELAELLPPLIEEQRSSLGADLLSNGCYFPIVVNEDLAVVDIHSRFGFS